MYFKWKDFKKTAYKFQLAQFLDYQPAERTVLLVLVIDLICLSVATQSALIIITQFAGAGLTIGIDLQMNIKSLASSQADQNVCNYLQTFDNNSRLARRCDTKSSIINVDSGLLHTSL